MKAQALSLKNDSRNLPQTKEEKVLTLEDIVKEFQECPFFHHLGLEVIRFEEGDVLLKLEMKEELLNTNGTMHGGVYASLLDFVQSMHLRSVTKTRCVTTSLNVLYAAPVMSGTVYAEAEIISKGYKTAFVEAVLKDETGKLVSKGTGTFKLIRPTEK